MRSWDLVSCVDSKILGRTGVIPLKQPQLKSLSLVTCYTCDSGDFGADCEIDLTVFHELHHLSWRGLNRSHQRAVSTAIQRNSGHMETLELDFGNWRRLRGTLMSDDADEEYNPQEYFSREVLCLNEKPTHLLFPRIRSLSLSHVALSSTVSHALSLRTLESLTIRACPGWDEFLDCLLLQNIGIRLTRLEIQESDDATVGASEETLLRFLSASKGLNELCILLAGPTNPLPLWNHISSHLGSIERFVYHQRTKIERHSVDVEDLRIENPSQNPLGTLGLDFLGICCSPCTLVRHQPMTLRPKCYI